ncbi:flagellar basal-body MS-ring/collar protein FliF [Terricaulis sp.]|uniref:flagellar basal-body MS-ring/collar protein FliF n=1 Tax=Terricaulis sp. TaxID=2768686 RepID=UPI0037844A14
MFDFILKAGPTRLFAALGIAAVAAALLFTLVFRMGAEEKSLLFSGVDMREAGQITQRLEQADIPYELRGDGSSIFVARSRVMEARMMLAADGLPSRGSVGYEIFDQPDALGQTQFQQNINRLRALEGELARTIASLDGISSARVHLVLPERQLFSRETEQPSASIVLQLRRDALTPGQVRAIRNLVASATPGLTTNRVTILDETGRLLAAAQDEEGAIAEGIDARQAATEERIRQTVTDIVEGVVGPGHARVQVNAEMDFSRVSETSERFDPEGRVVRSTQTSEGTSQSADRAQGATAGVNVPDATSGGGSSSGSTDSDSTSSETVNYEISRTTRTELTEGGRVRRLSVAVAVDGTTAAGQNGQPGQYSPRSEEEMQRLTALVRSAVGFNEQRGDRVDVVNVRFAAGAVPAAAPAPGMFDFMGGLDVMRVIEIVASLIAALAFVFFVLRPLIMGLIRGGSANAAAPGGVPMLAGPSGSGAAAALPPPEDEPGIDIAQIQGRVRASSVKKVAEVVEQHPDESVQIIRGWLNNAM